MTGTMKTRTMKPLCGRYIQKGINITGVVKNQLYNPVMKKYICYSMLVLAGLMTGACEDFLEEDPGEVTIDADLNNEEATRGFANSAYSEIDVLAEPSGGWGSNTMSMLEFITGKAGGVAQTEAFRFNQLIHDPTSFYLEDYWRRFYLGIQNCNIAIEKIGDFPDLPDQLRTNLLAEVRTMRALYYFYLVRMFGDVPKITENISNLEDVLTPRSPVKEIYDEIIIPDLEAAENSTLPWQDNMGRVSMGLVKALLADVYLTYAGYPVQGGEQYYAESASRSRELIEEGGYSLFPEYADLRDPARENSGELIFQVQFDKENRPNQLTPVCLPPSRDVSAGYTDEYGGLTPRPEFVASFEEGDRRTEEQQFFFSRYVNRGEEIDLGRPYIFKYHDQQAVDVDARSQVNFTVYRLADVMLLYAEASNRSGGGPDQLALQCVNDIRERADLDPVSSMPVGDFEKEVWSQRYFELCYEGKMWFDMVRTRQVRNDETQNWENLVGHTNLFRAQFQEKHLLFPIPDREMRSNSALEQNPGY